MKDCDDFQLLISRMLDDDLNQAERGELAEHVKRCPDCAAVYVAFRSLSEQLREEPEPLPAGLHENIMANIRRSGLRSVSPEKRRQKRWRALLATAACFVVVAAAGLGLPKLMGAMGASSAAPRADEAAVVHDRVRARGDAAQSAPAAAPDMAEMAEPEAEEFSAAEFNEAPATQKSAGTVRLNDAGEYELDEQRSDALEAMLTKEQVVLTEMPERELVVVSTREGEERRMTLLVCGEDAVLVAADGDLFYRVDGGAEALLALLGLS